MKRANTSRFDESPSVLLVDDDRDTLEELKCLIEANGEYCLCAGNALDALLLIEANPSLQILITDLHLPAFSGLDLIEKVLETRTDRAIASIVVTGRATLDSAVRAIRSDVIDFVQKPLRPADLLTAIDRARKKLGEMASLANRIPDGDGVNIGDLLSTVQRSSFSLLDGRRLLDPMWAVLIDLFRAENRGQRLSLTTVGLGATTSSSTLLRRANELIVDGVLRREDDPLDGRRTFLTFTPEGRAELVRLLDALQVRTGKI